MPRDALKTLTGSSNTSTDQVYTSVTGTDVTVSGIDKRALDIFLVGSTQISTIRTIFNVTLGTINTEQSQALPADTKEYIIKTRNNATLKLAFVSTESGTKFVTIPGGAVFEDSNFTSALTLFFQSPSTGDTVEIVAYS